MSPPESSEPPFAQPRLRLLAIGAVVAAVVALFACAAGWLTPQSLTPRRMVDRFEEVNGLHSGFRRNHAKGVCVSGHFDSNGRGAALSKASVFRGGRVPVIGRFSLAGGQPNVVDAARTGRGLGLLFSLADGQEWRAALLNLPVFPVRTPEAFYEQLLAAAPDPATGRPDPARMGLFLARHPESARALQAIGSHAVSSGFENSAFNSLNAFRFTDAAGTVTSVRWSLVPVQPFEPADTTVATRTDTNYLFDALIASIHSHPLQWHLMLMVGRPDDPTSDATLAWPPDRQQVDVGLLTLDRVEAEVNSPARDINFDPLILPSGIASSDDPLLSARSAVYARSFTRREGEPKTPSAISVAEVGR